MDGYKSKLKKLAMVKNKEGSMNVKVEKDNVADKSSKKGEKKEAEHKEAIKPIARGVKHWHPRSEKVPEVKKPTREEAVAQFEKAIVLYYDKKFNEAIAEFQKVVGKFDHFIEIAEKAKEYMNYCRSEKNKT